MYMYDGSLQDALCFLLDKIFKGLLKSVASAQKHLLLFFFFFAVS